MNYFLSTNNLNHSIKHKRLLADVNVSIKQGDFVGLLGPNGSGKTTLLRCLYGQIKTQDSSILLNQQCINQLSTKQLAKIIAIVFQEQNNEILLTVDEVLKLGRIPHQSVFALPQHEFSAAEQTIIDHLDLVELLHREFQYLSGGEKQRVMIARALFQKPQILILDEPTNHLDIAHQLSILSYLKSLPITIVCSLHDLNLASQFCDELILLNQGCVVKQGCPEAVLEPNLISEVYQVNAYCDLHPKTGFHRINFY